MGRGDGGGEREFPRQVWVMARREDEERVEMVSLELGGRVERVGVVVGEVERAMEPTAEAKGGRGVATGAPGWTASAGRRPRPPNPSPCCKNP